MRTILALLAASALGALAGCGPGGERERASGDRLRVVATTMQLQDFARQVGGARVEVTGILRPGAEPHEYEPTPSDADAVSEADVVVANGAGLDGWLDDLLANAGAGAQRVTAVDGIELLPTGQEGLAGDPHVWHDPERAKAMVDNVARGLARADPERRRAYGRAAERYKRRLDEMAARIRAGFEPIPPERRTLVKSHDSFRYFARAYYV